MDSTSRLSLSKIQTDALDPVSALRTCINDNANKLDNAGIFTHGAGAPAAAPGIVDRWYHNDTNGDVYRDDGTAWVLMIPGSGGVAPGDLADEIAARIAADNAEASARSTAISSEAATRASADATLTTAVATKLNASDASVTNARTPTAHATSHQEGGSDDAGLPPIGTIIAYAGTALPSGGKWDWADGGLINRTTFATFFARVGHAYNGGVDPGSSQVRKPDKRGRVPVGADNFGTTGAANRIPNSNRVIGQNGGEERHALLTAELAAHNHGVTDPGHSHGLVHPNHLALDNGIHWAFATSAAGPDILSDSSSVSSATTGITTQNNGSGTAHNNLQPYECDTFLVRVA